MTEEDCTAGADGVGSAGISGVDFVQHFFHRANAIMPRISMLPIMATSEVNNQWSDVNGLPSSSNFWRSSFASNLPVILDLSSLIT
jgi:hypothetical protein